MAKCAHPDCVHGFVHRKNTLDDHGKLRIRQYEPCPRCNGTGFESCCEGPIPCEYTANYKLGVKIK